MPKLQPYFLENLFCRATLYQCFGPVFWTSPLYQYLYQFKPGSSIFETSCSPTSHSHRQTEMLQVLFNLIQYFLHPDSQWPRLSPLFFLSGASNKETDQWHYKFVSKIKFNDVGLFRPSRSYYWQGVALRKLSLVQIVCPSGVFPSAFHFSVILRQ